MITTMRPKVQSRYGLAKKDWRKVPFPNHLQVMTVTELIEKHYWGEHDRDKARQFAIDLLEMMTVNAKNGRVVSQVDLSGTSLAIDKALEELRK